MKRIPLIELAAGIGVALTIFLAYQGFNVMPVLFLAGVLMVLTQSGAIRNLSPRKVTNAPSGSVPAIKFEDIGGQMSAKKELLEAVEFISNREQIRKMGIRPLKGVLLTGPPGTGKTLLAKAVAHHTNSVFLAAAGSEFVEMYAGVGAQRVRDLFRRGREVARREKKTSVIIFIDEIDVLGARRGSHSTHMEYDQTLNQLLVEMDGLVVDEEVQVLMMGATNRSDMLDPALMRPGRFDRIVNVDLPDKEGRLMILQLHTRTKPLAVDVDLVDLAKQTFGFSGAHLEALTNEAAILALREGRDEISRAHLTEAVDKVILGEKMDRKPPAAEKRRIAIHEGGHALVGEWVEPGSVSTITVTPRGRALGYVRTHPPDDHYLYTRPMLERQIQVALAGFLAEELIYGEGSTGAAADFDRVVDLARRIVHAGLTELGVIDPDTANKSVEGDVVNGIIREQQRQVRWFLEQRREALVQVAEILVMNEVMPGDELRRMLAEAPPLAEVPEPETAAAVVLGNSGHAPEEHQAEVPAQDPESAGDTENVA